MALFRTRNLASLLSKVLCFLLIFSLRSSPSSSQDTNFLGKEPTAYEMLRDYDFPIGILPKGVIGYELDAKTGEFSALFNGTCSFSLEGSYQLRYKSTIKGYISKGRLRSLEGVSVKLLFMWVDIVEVSRSGDDLEFSVGIAGAGFPIDNFLECPQCGCGFVCGEKRKVFNFRTNSLVSSS